MPIRARSILLLLFAGAVLSAAGAWYARPAVQATSQDQLTLGVSLTPTSAGLRVEAVARQGIAADVGIHAGDLLVGVDRRSVTTVAELEQRIRAERRSQDLAIQVLRDGVVTEAFLASSRRQRERNAAEPVADRNCTTLTLDHAAGVYREGGCSIARRKLCNGCMGG